MKIINNLSDWHQIRNQLHVSSTIGFVPTMGNLHCGHASLLKKCQHENDLTVTSLFVNPTQFNQQEDFINYPRTLDADIALLQQLHVDYCLLPEKDAIYTAGLEYTIEENELSCLMEGAQRPGHFAGVLTVVMKLFNLVKPNNAYFGEKDYQQYLLIKGMVQAFFLDIAVHACPTIREASGLAYSSRNNRLSVAQKEKAEKFAQIFHQNKSCHDLIQELEAQGEIVVNYLQDYKERRYAAVTIGNIRLIDNYNIAFPIKI